MSVSLKKLWNEYGIGGLLVALIVLYGLFLLYKNLMSKGLAGNELMSQERKQAYQNTAGPQPAQEGGNENYTSVSGSMQTMGPTITENQNPSDLLPRDTNSQWAQLNPAGKGDLANINLLKAGYHIGIDTIGQSLRNPNLQIRSEPPNPQGNVGPWNQSTIEPDTMRPPLEIGQGSI
jgi:hypothetical protein